MPVSLHPSSFLDTLSNAGADSHPSGGVGWNALAGSGQSIAADFDHSTWFLPYNDSIIGNEKFYMQNLNSRLATYLEKVVALERANLKLEQKIKEFNESKSTNTRTDLSKHYIIIEELQKQIISMAVEKQQVFMTLENANLAASDFKMKFENERNARLIVEADLARLHALIGETETATKDLQIQKAALEEELIFLKKSHEENMHMVQNQQTDTLNVRVDCAPAANLDKELEDMREQYETLIRNNRKQTEQWFRSKVKHLNTEVVENQTEITSSQKGLSELRKTYQKLEIEMKAIQTQKQTLQTDLLQVGTRYSEQLSQLQVYVDRRQKELQQITANMQQQAVEYEMLLNIKMRLEQEIEEYRRLLGEELQGYITQETNTSETVTVTETIGVETQEEEKEKHVHQQRVTVITEKLVDGVVVSTSTEEIVKDLDA